MCDHLYLNNRRKAVKRLTFSLLILICLMIAVWIPSRYLRARWLNVPPAPPTLGASMVGLGDTQYAYRILSVMLQNIGDSGGRVVSYKNFDYQHLSNWLFVMDQMDSESSYIPLLAAYVFSATEQPENLRYLIDYLQTVGSREGRERWRWLAQAVYLARFKMEDYALALNLAEQLANHPEPDRPGWSYQMPAFVLRQSGDKQAAYDVMVEILKNDAENLHPNEVYFMVEYICTRLLDKSAREIDPVCQGFEWKSLNVK